MESKRAPLPSPESAVNSSNAAQKPDSIDVDAKVTKSKKAPLPAGAILNAQLYTETKDTPSGNPKPEKDDWNIEALFGSHEQKSTPEEDQTPEPLTDDEAREAIRDYIEDRSEAVDSELSDVDEESPLAEIVSANQVLLDKLREQVTASEKPADTIIEEATQSTIQELHLDQNETDDEAAQSTLDRTPEEPLRTTVRRKEAAIASILTEEAPEEPNEPPASAGLPPSPPSHTEVGTSDPEPEPLDSTSEVPMPFSDDLAREVHTAHSSHETQPAAVPQTSPERTESGGFTRGDVARGVLVGGIAGYMVGRRSGRKHARAETRPVHAEMTREIANLQQKIAKNEQAIRSLAAQKTARFQAEKTQSQPAFESEKLNAGWPEPTRPAGVSVHKPMPRKTLVKSVRNNEVSVVPLDVAASQEKTSAGLSGKEKILAKPRIRPSQEQIRAVRPIEKLPIEDVLSLAKTVKVEGKTLDTYYKQGQLTESGMRKVLVEYRRSGRPERVFYGQISTHEHRSSSNTVENKNISQHGRRTSPPSVRHEGQATSVSETAQQHISQTFTEAIREAHPLPADKIHADNTPRVGATLTIGIVVLVIFAFFIVRIILT